MKRTLLLIAISVIAFKSQAQTEAGKFMLGGGATFNSSKNSSDDRANFAWAVIPRAGYFVKNNLAIGAGIGYQELKYSQNNYFQGEAVLSRIKQPTWTVSPFARYYSNITEQFKFFGQLAVPMSFGTSKKGDENGKNYVKTSTNNVIGASLSPGVAFFPGGKKISIEFSVDGLRYQHSSYKGTTSGTEFKSTANQFSIDASLLAPNIGIYFYL